ncbi:type I secretion system permease/ATPase [Sulfuriroseicoccus oceanibius]|uniref:Type I secretion system permease/ATPase n=2 Tax=Sulfuriroseicoccus oceanibius TaxID=2707525 RepID=A0A6B3L7N6_9BACT|nr:type I secretion system permease/ATPase [Sulfuriroseicoccus oceanibius]
MAGWHSISFSWDEASAGVPVEKASISMESLLEIARRIGFQCRLVKRPIAKLHEAVLPALLILKEGGVAVIEPSGQAGAPNTLEWDKEKQQWVNIGRGALNKLYSGYLVMFRPSGFESRFEEENRSAAYAAGDNTGWFWKTVWQFKSEILRAIPASLMVNLFAIAMPIFTMTVYDRVVPNNAVETLWVLAVGVLAIFVFEFFMRLLRGAFLGRLGKRLDGVLSGMVYDHLMAVSMKGKTGSSGILAGKARAYESLREFFISATLAGLVDMPISLLMIGVIFHLGGPVGWVPVAAAICMLVMGFLARFPLMRVASESYRQGLERQAFLAETIHGLEAVKGSNSQGFFRHRMERMIRDSSDVDVKAHWYSLLANCSSSWIINTSNVILVVLCVFQVKAGDMTMGAMIACIILLSRALNPLASVAAIGTRLAQVKTSLKGLSEVMAMPLEYGGDQSQKFSLVTELVPDYQLKDVNLKYDDEGRYAIKGLNLHIRPGECWAVLGKIGSGKSSLLKLLNKINEPCDGQILLNDLDYSQYHPATLRRLAGYMQQESALFQGTLRDNLSLGKPWASDEEIIEVANKIGIGDLINSHPMGLYAPVTERGQSFSGGERQAICLARVLLQTPKVLLLDEPTANMDVTSEMRALKAIQAYVKEDPERAMVVATHKMSVVKIATHCLVLDQGKVYLSGPRDKVLAKLREQASEGQPQAKH